MPSKSDDRRVPGARDGRIGIYERPARWKAWLPKVAAGVLLATVALVLAFNFW